MYLSSRAPPNSVKPSLSSRTLEPRWSHAHRPGRRLPLRRRRRHAAVVVARGGRALRADAAWVARATRRLPPRSPAGAAAAAGCRRRRRRAPGRRRLALGRAPLEPLRERERRSRRRARRRRRARGTRRRRPEQRERLVFDAQRSSISAIGWVRRRAPHAAASTAQGAWLARPAGRRGARRRASTAQTRGGGRRTPARGLVGGRRQPQREHRAHQVADAAAGIGRAALHRVVRDSSHPRVVRRPGTPPCRRRTARQSRRRTCTFGRRQPRGARLVEVFERRVVILAGADRQQLRVPHFGQYLSSAAFHPAAVGGSAPSKAA